MTEPITAYIKVSEKVKTNFNVVVVQECTPVTYDENGNYTPTNWTIDKSCQGGTSRFLWQISLGYCFSI